MNIIAYRTVGWKYIPLPLDSESFWQMMTYLQHKVKAQPSEDSVDTGFHGLHLNTFDLNEFGYPVVIYSDPFGVFNEFIYSQYKFKGSDIASTQETFEPRYGDCVIDCGACFGGTSLYFANKVGGTGKVLSFEFMPDNIKVFSENLKRNPNLNERIELIQHPVFSKNGIIMVVEGSGPATQVHSLGKGLRMYAKAAKLWFMSKIRNNKVKLVKSTTIDDEVRARSIKNVGLIKMDIEGSEYSALVGAKNTIIECKPLLAICVYHRLIDFYEVPQFIHGLGLGYKFHLQHSTVHGDETVVFAIPPR